MSEVGWYETKLRIVAGTREYASRIEESPSFQILNRALEMVAEQYNGKMVQAVKDYFGNETQCDLAVVVPNFERGVGIKVDRLNGAVRFIYDPYGGYDKIAQDIADALIQNYTAIALIRAMKSLGYKVREESAKAGQRGNVALIGVM